MQRSKLMELSIKFNGKISKISKNKENNAESEIGTPAYWMESANRLMPLAGFLYIAFLAILAIILFSNLPLFLIAIIAVPVAFIDLIFRRYLSYSKMDSNYIEPTQRDMVYGIILTSLIAIIAWLIVSMMANRLF